VSRAVGFTLARLVVVALLLSALSAHTYAYYEVLRVMTCAVAAFGAWLAAGERRAGWAWVFGTIGLLFNPIVPVRLGRDAWTVIDLGAAAVFLVSLRALPQRRRLASQARVVEQSASRLQEHSAASQAAPEHRSATPREDASSGPRSHSSHHFPPTGANSANEDADDFEEDADSAPRGPWDCLECGRRNYDSHSRCGRCGYEVRD
jgi:hypothetical protein